MDIQEDAATQDLDPLLRVDGAAPPERGLRAPRLSADAQTSAAGCDRKRSALAEATVQLLSLRIGTDGTPEFATGRPSGRVAERGSTSSRA
jgi:hypothetical protein